MAALLSAAHSCVGNPALLVVVSTSTTAAPHAQSRNESHSTVPLFSSAFSPSTQLFLLPCHPPSSRKKPARAKSRRIQVIAKKDDGIQSYVTTAARVGLEALESATSLVPASVPRPVARAGVAGAAVILSLTLISAAFNTLITLLVVGGLSYAAVVYFTGGRGGGSSGGGATGGISPDDSLEEAKRIMEKYK
eukprot:TRINITY_DN1530_c0_g1_i2.p1 TRINITY_DN1530_c0_g1~~TRINITY_DN1530_c0_g1_i2.p1  ORF type:complete len:192 (-),score=48.80 TRINITY_DN1530_c0_g1_i2:151-726(-)